MRTLVLVIAGLAIGFAPLGAALEIFPLGVADIKAETIQVERTEGLAVAAPVAAEAERPAGTRD
jgi:hypothetical protein